MPLSTRLVALFGSLIVQLGAFFFVLGMAFWWAFGAGTGIVAWIKLSGDVREANGVVVSAEETGISEGGSDTTPGTPIFRIAYRFNPGGAEFEGASYDVGFNPQPGQGVVIEFLPDDPATSRIKDTRTSPLGILGLLVGIFPLTGLVMLLIGLRKGRRNARIVARGKITRGRMVDKQPTNVRVNKQTVYRYTFEFDGEDGQTHQITDKTHHTSLVEDEESERILYDPANPTAGRLVDTLPGRPKVNEDGTLSSVGAPAALLRMFLPVGGVLAHVIVGVIYYMP